MSLSFVYPQYLWLLILLPITIGLGLLGHRHLSRSRLRAGLILRALLLLAIVFALAGAQLRLRTDILTTVFVLDVSDSIPPEEKARGETLIRESIKNMPSGDRAAVILFGQDALVESLPSDGPLSSDLASIPVTVRTDIASALQLAQAILPNEGAKRLVLLSDGRENLGQALKQAELAAAHGIELLFVPLGSPGGEIEVLIETLESPTDIRQGENFDLVTVVQSTDAVGATLRIFIDDVLSQTRELGLQPGENRISITVNLSSHGKPPKETSQGSFRRFRAQIIPEADTLLQNNEASAFTVIHGPPAVLVVEGQTGEAENLERALEAAEMNVNRISPSEIPTGLADLVGYEAIVLVNSHADALPTGVMEALLIFVRDLGMGLVMIGGADSYGAGGYLRTPLEDALPVDMDVRNKDLQANLALVLAVDKSGSMARCHCDNPDLNQSYTRAESGQPKVDIAKEAIMRSAGALGDQDYLGVVAFDDQARWVLEVERLVDPLALERAIGSFQAEGQTNLQTGVQAAFQALQGVSAKRKHIILMTDGWVHQGDLTALAQEIEGQGITLSVVAAGEGSAEYLAALSQIGGGRYYPATDILSVPDIFLKETVTSIGQYIIEEAFYPLTAMPSPVLRGVDAASMPPLLGYNGTTAKNTARLDLLTPRGDPLLATWQYGLGRAAAWTSDLKGQWAKEWLNWEHFPQFAAQLVGWVMPAPQVEGLTASATLEEGQAVIHLEAVGENGQPLNFLEAVGTIVDPDLKTIELPLKQIGAGAYQASTHVSTPGTYLVRLGVNNGDQSLGKLTLGLVVPYSPEYKASGIDRNLLGELARVTGGGELIEPLAAFLHDLPATDERREIWQPLLLLAALLFPLDVAIRRVTLGSGDLRKGRDWLLDHLALRSSGKTEQPQLLGRLFQARERARQRQTEHAKPLEESSLDLAVQPPPETPDEHKEAHSRGEKHQADESEPTPGEDAGNTDDPLARLREAKKRARR